MELPLISVSSRYASKCPCCGFRARHALGSKLGAIPFFNQKKVIGLLDNPKAMDEDSRVANHQILMTVVRACALQDRF